MAGRTILGLVAASCALAADHPVAPTIAAVNGINYLSPLRGQNVTGIRGLVTAKGPQGFWIRSEVPDEDDRSSESIYVFGPSALAGAAVGDVITINGRVTEFRSSSAYLYLTQIDQPSNITVVSSGNEVVPLTIGAGGAWNPPTEQYSSLDQGDVFAVPNNRSLISVTNPTLEPRKYGLDFWESLTGELVTVPFPRALGKPNSFGDTWVVGDWPTTGSNGRGGLTITDRDANPEAIIIGSPLDGTSNPTTTRLGDSLQNITGVVTQAFGFYRILPLTTIEVTASRSPALPPPTGLTSNGLCSGLTVGQYNVENLNPQSDHLAAIAAHIVTDLHTPDLLFLQEIQDDTGPTDDAVVTSNATLTALRHAIQALRPSAPAYASVDVPPVDDRDGGQPGANIRVAYLYNPAAVRLVDVRPGNATQATDVLLPGPRLRYNPGLVDPASTAWEASRKPLAAHWETVDGEGSFFTVNVHFTSKGGSSSLHGDARPPVNGGVDQRERQADITARFVKQILDGDGDANVMVGGDFNEFATVQPLKTLAAVAGLRNQDDVNGLDEGERYTYLFDANSQQLDHMYVSPRLATASRSAYEHIHVNTWAAAGGEASDHDPSISRFNVCR